MAKKLSKPARLSKTDAARLVQQQSQNLGLERLGKLNWFTVILTVLLLMFIYLQAILWIGDGSLADVWRLKKSIAALEEENKSLRERNQMLINEVEALRSGTELIENHAREDLGLVKENEVFYHVIEDDNSHKNDN